MFGIADSLNRELTNARRVAKARDEYAEVRGRLLNLGMSAACIDLIENAVEGQEPIGAGKFKRSWYVHGFRAVKKADEDKRIARLREIGYIHTNRDGINYWLTRDGQSFRDLLEIKRTEWEKAKKVKNQGKTLADDIRGCRWPKAMKRLDQRGITEYMAMLIADAVKVNEGLVIADFEVEENEIGAIQTLRNFDLIMPAGNHYWLTSEGTDLWQNLRAARPSKPIAIEDRILTDEAKHEAPSEDKLDINWGRDGLLSTTSKLMWGWFNPDELAALRMAKSAREYVEGHQQIEEAIQMIASSEQRVARRLIEQPIEINKPNEWWTEEMQRAQNDKYWASNGVAFWLNPLGLLADPTPAPEWWSPPKEEPKLITVHKTVEELSLLAPPKAPIDEVLETLEKMGEVRAEKDRIYYKNMLQKDITRGVSLVDNDAVTQAQIDLAARYIGFGRCDGRVYAFEHDREVEVWLQATKGMGHTYAARGTLTYGPLLREYEEQQNEELDEDNGFVILHFGDKVQGFPSRKAANLYIAAQKKAERDRVRQLEKEAAERLAQAEADIARREAEMFAKRSKANSLAQQQRNHIEAERIRKEAEQKSDYDRHLDDLEQEFAFSVTGPKGQSGPPGIPLVIDDMDEGWDDFDLDDFFE